MSDTDYNSKKVTELRSLCKKRGLSEQGKKQELMDRLQVDDQKKMVFAAQQNEPVSPKQSPRLSAAPNSPKPTPAFDLIMTDAEKAKVRAERFGVHNEDVEKVKKMARAERFGVNNEDVETQKKKQRAERFGTENAELEKEKKKEREDRFGTGNLLDEDKVKARQARFGGNKGDRNAKLDMPLTKEKKQGGASSETKGGASVESPEEAAKRTARMERFGASAMTEEQKKDARASRFA